MAGKKITISRREFVAVVDHVRAHLKDYQHGKVQKIAEVLGSRLGFPVSLTTVKEVCDILEIKRQGRRQPEEKKGCDCGELFLEVARLFELCGVDADELEKLTRG